MPKITGFGVDPRNPTIATDLTELKSLGVDYVRIQFLGTNTSNHLWNQSMQNNQFLLASLMPMIRALGLKIIIDMHHWPLMNDNYNAIYTDSSIQQVFISRWQAIANEYKDDPNVVAFELMNEPGAGNMVAYRTLMLNVIGAVRAIAPNKPLIVPSPGTTMGQFNKLKPFPDKNILYCFHLWDWPRIQQDIKSVRKDSARKWGKVQVQEAKEMIQKVKNWQARHQVGDNNIIVTEIGCPRYSGYPHFQNCSVFFNDILPLINKAGWGYIIHAFREADCWDYEAGFSPNEGRKTSSKIMQVILANI